MTKLFAVMGKPILHSKSPSIHNLAFKQIGFDGIYLRLAAESAKEALECAEEIGITGLNITSPFKESILLYLDKVDKNASEVGAVNTIIKKRYIKKKDEREDESKNKNEYVWRGYNTDITGVKMSFDKKGVKIKGKKTVILGAGGAGKAAAYALVSAGANVTIINRTFEKAQKIANKFGCSAASLDNLKDELKNAEILISCIPLNHNLVSEDMIHNRLMVLDAYYTTTSKLVKLCKGKCKVIGALDWLLYQAVESFELFTGKKAPERVMKNVLYKKEDRKNKQKQKSNIALIGFMGVGKTATAKWISKLTEMNVLETDDIIERNSGMKIKEIFERFGEKEFRTMESKAIKGIAKVKNSVISCGGGVVLDKKNIEEIKKHSIIVWLWANENEIEKRVKGDSRPLLNTTNKKERIRNLLKERIVAYAKSCDFVIDTKGKKPREIAERIILETKILDNGKR